ncbi:MAG: hypothetical protein AAGJ93_17635, partial [Bacteroidota bacterium]
SNDWIVDVQGCLNMVTFEDVVAAKYFKDVTGGRNINERNALPFSCKAEEDISEILTTVEPYYQSIRFLNKGKSVMTLFKKDEPKYYHADTRKTETKKFHHDQWRTDFDWSFLANDEYLSEI